MINPFVQFKDRADAGRQLAGRLVQYSHEHPIVMGLPRGGVVVASEIARALGAPLDIIAVRKIGAPGYPEFGIGALVDGEHPEVVLDERAMRALGLSAADVQDRIEAETRELQRRQRLYRGNVAPANVHGRFVIVADDGIATGSTVRAALRGLQGSEPARLILATPVASPQALEILRNECDEIVCLFAPQTFQAVGAFYEQFEQTPDEEVIRLLNEARGTVRKPVTSTGAATGRSS